MPSSPRWWTGWPTRPATAAATRPPRRRPRPPARPRPTGGRRRRRRRSGAGDRAPAATGAGEATRDVVVGHGASDVERLADVRLEALDEAELALVARYVRRLALAPPPRRARRARTARHGERLDVRATLRRSRRTAGDPVQHLHRRRRLRPRRLVALLDVSGSMAPYARAYLLLLEGAARGAHAETFVFATRLTRVTRALREGRAQAALVRASAAAPDWAGGHAARRGAARLQRRLRPPRDGARRRRGRLLRRLGARRPGAARARDGAARRGSPTGSSGSTRASPRLGSRPRTGGMAAALPHIDELVSGHSLAALDAVVEAIGRQR